MDYTHRVWICARAVQVASDESSGDGGGVVGENRQIRNVDMRRDQLNLIRCLQGGIPLELKSISPESVVNRMLPLVHSKLEASAMTSKLRSLVKKTPPLAIFTAKPFPTNVSRFMLHSLRRHQSSQRQIRHHY